MIVTNPSRFWYVEKEGTPVAKFDTAGNTQINVPSNVDVIESESRAELSDIETDISVLTEEERFLLGVY